MTQDHPSRCYQFDKIYIIRRIGMNHKNHPINCTGTRTRQVLDPFASGKDQLVTDAPISLKRPATVTVNRRRFLAASTAGVAGFGLSRLFKSSNAYGANGTEVRFREREGFSFLHTYESTGRYWKALEQAGLIRKTNGIRLINSPWGGDEYRFNQAARRDGPLFQLIRKMQCPFVIDRVVGGSRYYHYPFDAELAKTYADLLGSNFLGGQVHEPVSNTHNDWNRFIEANSKYKQEAVNPEELQAYFSGKNERHWLEYGTLEDYAGRVFPKNETEFWPEIQLNVERNAKRFGSHFSCAEGSGWGRLAWHIYYKLGANSCFAEMGPWASDGSQFAIAGIRGAAKAAGRQWGVFFAPWGPKGCTSFIPPEDWSWHCPVEEMLASGWPVGPELGPSSALQRRVFFHSYLSGAYTLHEEWGAEDNLESWADAKLSSYGRVTQDLLDFQEAHPDVGHPFTPLALILDASARPPVSDTWDRLKSGLQDVAAQNGENKNRSGAVEAACYPSWVIPELFDIVPSDAPEDILSGYQSLLCFDKSCAPRNARVVEPDAFTESVIQTVRELSPIECSGDLSIQINHRDADNAWIIGLYNPWGAERGDVYGTGSVLDPQSARHGVLRPKFGFSSAKVIHAWPEECKLEASEKNLEVTVGPGGTMILEIHPKV